MFPSPATQAKHACNNGTRAAVSHGCNDQCSSNTNQIKGHSWCFTFHSPCCWAHPTSCHEPVLCSSLRRKAFNYSSSHGRGCSGAPAHAHVQMTFTSPCRHFQGHGRHPRQMYLRAGHLPKERWKMRLYSGPTPARKSALARHLAPVQLHLSQDARVEIRSGGTQAAAIANIVKVKFAPRN